MDTNGRVTAARAIIKSEVERRSLTVRRSLETLRTSLREGQASQTEIVRDHILRFANILQGRYPFSFGKGFRGHVGEQHRWVQERLLTHFLFGAVAEFSGMDESLIEKAWILGTNLSKSVGKGGEHFRPNEFDATDKALAREIGEANFELLLEKLEELAHQLEFKLGPINPSEHSIVWCFRYLRLLLMAAKWESAVHPQGTVWSTTTIPSGMADLPTDSDPGH